MISNEQIKELESWLASTDIVDNNLFLVGCIKRFPEFVKRLRWAEARIEELQLLAMDEDNLWDLARANEVRAAIRDHAASYFASLEGT